MRLILHPVRHYGHSHTGRSAYSPVRHYGHSHTGRSAYSPVKDRRTKGVMLRGRLSVYGEQDRFRYYLGRHYKLSRTKVVELTKQHQLKYIRTFPSLTYSIGTLSSDLSTEINLKQKKSKTEKKFKSDLEWFASNPSELEKYRGKFVAIYNQEIVGHGNTAVEAENIAKKNKPSSDAVVVYLEEDAAVLYSIV